MHHAHILSLSLMSRRVRRAGEIEKRAAIVPALVPAPAPETGTTDTTSPNTGKRDAAKATATRTGVAAAPQRSPRIKRGVDTDERGEDHNSFGIYVFLILKCWFPVESPDLDFKRNQMIVTLSLRKKKKVFYVYIKTVADEL